MACLPTVDELTGAFWRRGWTPVRHGSTKAQRSVAELAATQWTAGPTRAREFARQLEILGDADKCRLFAEKPSERARPCFTSAHPTPDFISIPPDARGAPPRVTDEVALYIAQPRQLPHFDGDRGYAIAERLCKAWKQKRGKRGDAVFCAWLVERHSHRVRTASAAVAQRERRERTRHLRQASTWAGSAPTLVARVGRHPCDRARQLTTGRKLVKIQLLHVQRAAIENVYDARSVSLAVCTIE